MNVGVIHTLTSIGLMAKATSVLTQFIKVFKRILIFI